MDIEGQIDSGSDTSSGMSDEQMDSLLTQEAPSREIPMSAPRPQAAAPQNYKIKVNGKEIEAPLDKVLKWAEMGYNYPQKAAELNQKEQAFLSRQKQIEELENKFKPYKEVDEYASKNPDWWTQVQQSYQQKIAGAQTNPELQQLKEELQDLKKFRDEYSSEKQSLKTQEEDKKLSGEVESIRKSYPNIDFDSPDDEGKSLEMKVLQHAMDQGIQSFRVAFRDYYHDHLLGKAKEEGKELVSKTIQQRSKLGILGETSKPTKGLKSAENVKNKTYEQLAREALDELGA
jgi:hypothetical protein